MTELTDAERAQLAAWLDWRYEERTATDNDTVNQYGVWLNRDGDLMYHDDEWFKPPTGNQMLVLMNHAQQNYYPIELCALDPDESFDDGAHWYAAMGGEGRQYEATAPVAVAMAILAALGMSR